VLGGLGVAASLIQQQTTAAFAPESFPQCANPIVIEGAAVKRPGIFCLDTAIEDAIGTSSHDLLSNAGVDVSCRLPARWTEPIKPIRSGDRLRVDVTPSGACVAVSEPLPSATKLLLGLRIDLNTASIQELTEIPGIGEKTAASIVEHRKLYGPYRSLAELDEIPGIGRATLKRLEPYLNL